jgi:hypothetical protein
MKKRDKMKRFIVLSALLTVLSLLSSVIIAAAVDIVPYMGLKPGKWSIMQETDSPSRQGSVIVKGTNGQIVEEWYSVDGSGWTSDGSTVYKITPTDLLLIGENDGKDLWTYEPVLAFPRKISLNQPVPYNGILRNQRTQATRRITLLFMITKSGLTVDTQQAGTFKNCIKVRIYEYSAGVSRDATNLEAPGRGKVKHWRCKIKDTPDPIQEIQSVSSYELIQFGDSNPPIP